MSQAREKIDYRPVQTRHTREMEEAVIRVMREASSYTMGEEVKAFEKEFAEFMGAKAAEGATVRQRIMRGKGLSMNNVYTLLLACGPQPEGARRRALAPKCKRYSLTGPNLAET